MPLVTTKPDSCGVVVPTPTGPPVNKAEFVALLNVVDPVIVLAAVPDCVYPPLVVIPVEALIAPAWVTVKALAPTPNMAVGAQVPIPTFPLVTTNPANCGVIVPIPTLPPITAKRAVFPPVSVVPIPVLPEEVLSTVWPVTSKLAILLVAPPLD